MPLCMIERINENIAEGMPFFEAIVSGGARRFRAVFLTNFVYGRPINAPYYGNRPSGEISDSNGAFPLPRALPLQRF